MVHMRTGANGCEHELPRWQELGLRGRGVQGHHCQREGHRRRRFNVWVVVTTERLCNDHDQHRMNSGSCLGGGHDGQGLVEKRSKS